MKHNMTHKLIFTSRSLLAGKQPYHIDDHVQMVELECGDWVADISNNLKYEVKDGKLLTSKLGLGKAYYKPSH